MPQLPSLIVALQKVANRIFSGLVLAGLLVASAMLLPYWRILGLTGFVSAAALALYMVFTIMLSDRSSKRDGLSPGAMLGRGDVARAVADIELPADVNGSAWTSPSERAKVVDRENRLPLRRV